MEDSRVVMVMDVDCFAYQVHQMKYPSLRGLEGPAIVVNQSNIILTANYPARKAGIRKGMPSINDVLRHTRHVVIECGNRHGVQDTYTEQVDSDRVISALKNFKEELPDPTSMIIQRHSQDEFYVDITDLVNERESNVDPACFEPLTKGKSSYPTEPVLKVEGIATFSGEALPPRIQQVFSGTESIVAEKRLLIGALIAWELMLLVKKNTVVPAKGGVPFPGYDVSVGISSNITKAKLAMQWNKPDGITVFTNDKEALERICRKVTLEHISGFGGKRGQELLEDLRLLPEANLWELYNSINEDECDRDELRLRLVDRTPVEQAYYQKTLTQSMPIVPVPGKTNREILLQIQNSLTTSFFEKLISKYWFWKVWPTVCRCKLHFQPKSTIKTKQFILKRWPEKTVLLEKLRKQGDVTVQEIHDNIHKITGTEEMLQQVKVVVTDTIVEHVKEWNVQTTSQRNKRRKISIEVKDMCKLELCAEKFEEI